MAVLKNTDGTELMIDCLCGCDKGIRFKIDVDDFDYYCFMSFTNGNFYTEQGDTMRDIWRKKFKKIRAILRNKDYYYSDITMSKDDFEIFREYINSIGKAD